MANPNIVSVASIYGESIFEALTTNVGTDIMTVLANKLVKINYISVSNTSLTVPITVTMAVVKSGFTSAGIASGEDNTGSCTLVSGVSCPGADVLIVVDKPIYLMELDVLEGGASIATASLFVSYEVISV
jgi:hypothetical protein